MLSRSLGCTVLLLAIAAAPFPLEDHRSTAPPLSASLCAESFELQSPSYNEVAPTPVIQLVNLITNHVLPRTAIAQESAISADTAARSSGGRSALFWVAWLTVAGLVFFGGRFLWRKYMVDANDAYPKQRS